MDIHQALYTTRMMRRLRPDPIPLETQASILDAAVRAPNGGNTQRWHFVAVDDRELIREFAQLFRQAPTSCLACPWRKAGRCQPC
jgi:nitroreductase